MESQEIKDGSFGEEREPRFVPDRTYDLTVVTVCRNALPYLKITLDSVLKQKSYNKLSIQHVIVDGASTDGTTEWLKEVWKEGKIDTYVSEPDCGIYDAMNKGIAMSRGKVLSFINAGDGYTDADLSDYVRLISCGKEKCVVGNADYLGLDGSFSHVDRYNPPAAYYNIMGCHQAYFFEAYACRELGGYDAESFRSAGDLELMNKFLRKYGMPHFVDVSVCFFRGGGFSTNCWILHRSEFVEIQWRYWQELMQRCREDRAFAAMMISMMVGHFQLLGKMDEAGLAKIARQKEELDEMLKTLYLPPFMPMKRACLRIVSAIAFSKRFRYIKNKILDFCNLICRVSYNNHYIFWGPKLIRYVRMLPFVKG